MCLGVPEQMSSKSALHVRKDCQTGGLKRSILGVFERLM